MVEVNVAGGLPGGAASHAIAPGTALTWQRRPAETEAAFRDRVRREAEAAGAAVVVVGGLDQ